jgi:hypothetical protein
MERGFPSDGKTERNKKKRTRKEHSWTKTYSTQKKDRWFRDSRDRDTLGLLG